MKNHQKIPEEAQIEMRNLVNLDNLHSPVLDALVKIGEPAIPALVQNLQLGDDLKVRQWSLKALLLIEGDKDVLKVRLQKALEAQTDSTKRDSLQLAIKSLPDVTPEKP